jgi:aryl-alcohol dehydrogenase-like predicted oxidoreductase
MKYRKLGNTDIDVSLIGLGSMTWGEQNTEAEAFEQMDMAIDAGINLFDNAEMYPVPPRPETQGSTEDIMGKWLAQRGCRDRVVLATKVTGRGDLNRGLEHIRNGARLNREHIVKALEDSLRRLRTDYVDLYQVHWPERQTNFFGKLGYSHAGDDGVPIAETLEVLDDLVKQGKVRHVGLSNETPWGMLEYLRLARERGQARVVSIQNPYNLLNRTFEVGAAEISIREQVSLLAYSPLAFGKLTGKYLHGNKPPKARLSLYERFTRYEKVNAEPATEAYVQLAREHGLDPAQMALAYVNGREFVASNVIGATSLEQLKADIDSVDIELREDVLQGIEEIHARYPNPAP